MEFCSFGGLGGVWEVTWIYIRNERRCSKDIPRHWLEAYLQSIGDYNTLASELDSCPFNLQILLGEEPSCLGIKFVHAERFKIHTADDPRAPPNGLSRVIHPHVVVIHHAILKPEKQDQKFSSMGVFPIDDAELVARRVVGGAIHPWRTRSHRANLRHLSCHRDALKAPPTIDHITNRPVVVATAQLLGGRLSRAYQVDPKQVCLRLLGVLHGCYVNFRVHISTFYTSMKRYPAFQRAQTHGPHMGRHSPDRQRSNSPVRLVIDWQVSSVGDLKGSRQVCYLTVTALANFGRDM